MRARVLSLPRFRRLVLLGAAVVALVLALPGSASANPVKDAVHTALNAVFDIPGANKVTNGFFLWLIAIPNFDGTAFANLMSRSNLVALALLCAVMTFSVVRYWLGALAGTSDGGAAAGMEGLIRTGGAVLAILLWPWLFENVTAIVNLTTRALLADGGVNTARLIGASISLGNIFNPLGIAIKFLSFGMLIALVAMKIFLVASLAALCAGAPFFIMLSPIRELAWVAANAGRALVVIWLAPIFWALELRAADAIRIHDLLTPQGGGIGESLANDLFLEPLVGIVIMYLLFKTPKHLRAGIAQATNATVGAPGHVPPGFMARAGSYLAGQVLGGLVLSRVPTTLGGRQQPDVVTKATVNPDTGETTLQQEHRNVVQGSEREQTLRQDAALTRINKDYAQYLKDEAQRERQGLAALERRARDGAQEARQEESRVERTADLQRRTEREVVADARTARLDDARSAKDKDAAWNWSPPTAETPQTDRAGRPSADVAGMSGARQRAAWEEAAARAHQSTPEQAREAWDGIGGERQQALRDIYADHDGPDAPDGFRQELAKLTAAPRMDPDMRAHFRTLLAADDIELEDLLYDPARS